MHFIRFSSALVLAVAITACSEDEDASPSTETAANQPAAGNGGGAGVGGNAAAGAAGNGGRAGAASASGGSSAEAPDDDIGLEPGNDDDDNGNGNAVNGSPDAGDANVAGDAGDAGDASDAGAPPAPPQGDAGAAADTSMSFFVTSTGGPDGGNFGGIQGADALCQTLATAVSPALGAKTWRAYLSTATVNARDRIGDGPWFNAAGVLVANDVAQLTDQGPGGVGGSLDQTWAPGDASIALDELGNQVPAGGAGGVQHDILTGTLLDGTVATGFTCGDWTQATGNVQVGHSNRAGFGDAPPSWSSAHNNVGCAPLTAPAPNVGSGGGRGSVYCFAAD